MSIFITAFAAHTEISNASMLWNYSRLQLSNVPFKSSFIQSYFWLFALLPFTSIQLHSGTESLSLILSTGVSLETDKCTSLQF